jgi:hypothetical protein
MDAEQTLRVRPDRPRLEARAARQRAQAVDGELVRVLGVDALAFVLEALGREHDRLLLPAHQVRLDALQRGVVEGVVRELLGQQLTLTSSTPVGCNKADTSARPGGHRRALFPKKIEELRPGARFRLVACA